MGDQDSVDGTLVTTCVDQVEVGDHVLTHSGFEKVLFIHMPKDADAVNDILEIEFSNGNTLGITEDHLMYDANKKMRVAGSFKIGEFVQTANGSTKVVKINRARSKVRSIVTMSGELIVDSVRLSSYSGSESRANVLHQLAILPRIIAKFDGVLAEKICKLSVPAVKYLMIRYL